MPRYPADHVYDEAGRCRYCSREDPKRAIPGTLTMPLGDVAALVKLAWEQTRYIEETDRSATGSIYGIEYADKTIARVAAQLPPEQRPIRT